MASPVQAREAIHQGDVVGVPLRGEVAPSLLAFLRRAVKTAENNEAAAIIFDAGAVSATATYLFPKTDAPEPVKIPSLSSGQLVLISTITELLAAIEDERLLRPHRRGVDQDAALETVQSNADLLSREEHQWSDIRVCARLVATEDLHC